MDTTVETAAPAAGEGAAPTVVEKKATVGRPPGATEKQKKEFGTLLYHYRSVAQLSQRKLAKLVNTSAANVCNWEAGANLPSLTSAELLFKAVPGLESDVAKLGVKFSPLYRAARRYRDRVVSRGRVVGHSRAKLNSAVKAELGNLEKVASIQSKAAKATTHTLARLKKGLAKLG